MSLAKSTGKRGHRVGVEPFLTWVVLLAVLILIARGRFRIEVVALTGLFLLGILGAAPARVLFSGFGHPALATIVAVFFLSQGIVDSGLMLGLGQALARRASSRRGQILGVAAAGSLLSAFMNNVGAVGLMLPTAVRMAKRSGLSPGSFGLPLAVASILGGTLTLIGSAPNIIIASYMFSLTGESFKMFDFAPHGLAMLLMAWLLFSASGRAPAGMPAGEGAGELPEPDRVIPFAPFSTRERRVTFAAILLAVLAVSTGLLHPALGFGGAVLLMYLFGIIRLPGAYRALDLKILFFLGAMLGMGEALEHTGALELLSGVLAGFTEGVPPFLLILLLIFVSSALSNAVNNAAAAVFMAPLAAGLAAGGGLGVGAALMAVAAGSNMTLLLPTHQAALMVMSKAPFDTAAFVRGGLVLSLFCGLAAAAVITLVWR